MPTITERSEFMAGVRAIAPVLIGIVPAGISLGASLGAAGFPLGPALLSAATVYGATPQLVLTDVASDGAPVLVTVAIVAAVSIRQVFYSAGLGRWFRGAGSTYRWLAPLLTVQPTYVVAEARFARPATIADRTAFFLGAGLTLWVAWQVGHAAGMLLGNVVPASLALDTALPLCLAAMLGSSRRERGAARTVIVAAVAAVVLAGLPYGSGVVVAASLGMAAGAR
jgi:branched chain amino acid efflux pump